MNFRDNPNRTITLIEKFDTANVSRLLLSDLLDATGKRTLEQPNHSSTAPEIHNTGLAHALLRANTLTRFARPPHDLLHTFPRQVAFAAPRCERSAAPTAAPSQCMRKVDQFPMSDGRNTCTMSVIRHSRKSVTRGKMIYFSVLFRE